MNLRGAALLTAQLATSLLAFSTAAPASAASSVARVWTEPAAGYGFLDSAILSAHHSLDMSMYELADTTLEHDLMVKATDGVVVHVLLDSAYYGKSDNAASFALLRSSHVQVEWAPANQIYHAKYVVIDGSTAYVGTGNLASKDYASTRDFWVEDTAPSDVHAIQSTFAADFARRGLTAVSSGGLVWSPGSTSTLVHLIGSARRSLLVENEEMDSTTVERALDAAAARGVDVKVVMTSSSSSKTALTGLAIDGVHVHVLDSAQVYIHAKVICADCAGAAGTVFIGSENFSTSSLSYNRELGVITSDPVAIRAVTSAVDADYAVGGAAFRTRPSRPVTTPSGSGAGVTVTAFLASVSAGDEDSLSIHSSRANDTCALGVVLPSGYTSESEGLGSERANAGGDDTWTWEVGPSTDRGTAHATITCGAGTVRRNFTIR